MQKQIQKTIQTNKQTIPQKPKKLLFSKKEKKIRLAGKKIIF